MSHQLLTNFPHDPLLDLAPWVGQRQASFRFELFDGVSGIEKGTLTPLRNASITHDTTRIIKRQLSLDLGVTDTARVEPLVDRVRVFMTFPNGAEYPLGVYMFTDRSRQKFSSGTLGNMVLNDEMFLVDQQIEAGISGFGINVSSVIERVLRGLPVDYTLEATAFQSAEAWGPGEYRGRILESLSISGDFFSPWFGNDGKLHFIRTFDPAAKIPDFDFDAHNRVVREPIILTDDILTAPNRFIVISNAAVDSTVPAVGVFDVPHTAPHSIARRGFVMADVHDLQLSSALQAQLVAEGLGQRLTAFERVSLTPPPAPRHDSYNVIRWDGSLWLELAWSMALVEGGNMAHLLRKAYVLHD